MSAKELRMAADLIHHDLAFGQEHGHPEFLAAVADQLDGMAAVIEEAADGPLAIVAAGLAEKSLAVARAYANTT